MFERKRLLVAGVKGFLSNKADMAVVAVKKRKNEGLRKKKLVRAIFSFISGPFILEQREKTARKEISELFRKKTLLRMWKHELEERR